MISVIITAYKEDRTIGKAIEAFLNQGIKYNEIIVVAPDEKTLDAAGKYKKVKTLRDPGRGKPAALNLTFSKVSKKSKILILSDGDVFIGEGAVEKILKCFNNKNIGAVSGHPVSLDSRDNLLGYWSHVLTDTWDSMRKSWQKNNKMVVASGYLLALRNGLVDKIPEDALSDDAMMSYMVFSKGYKIIYEPEAKVYIKYPTNMRDWIKQKRRSAAGYLQTKRYFKSMPTTRSFFKEIILGTFRILRHPQNLKELFYALLMFPYRAVLWGVIHLDRIRGKNLKDIWQPVESTK
ncbi:MAG: glycosyltransferase [Nanoarchaeota archaeon]